MRDIILALKIHMDGILHLDCSTQKENSQATDLIAEIILSTLDWDVYEKYFDVVNEMSHSHL